MKDKGYRISSRKDKTKSTVSDFLTWLLCFLRCCRNIPSSRRLHPLFLRFILSSHWLVCVRHVNAITPTPKNQWTLADSVSERTVSMDSHSFWGSSLDRVGRALLSNSGQF